MGIANLGVKMMDIKAWISNPKVIANSKKGYAHFDLRTDITKVSEYISNPEKVARHSFYPFIHYVMRMDKYNKKTGVKPKNARNLLCSSYGSLYLSILQCNTK